MGYEENRKLKLRGKWITLLLKTCFWVTALKRRVVPFYPEFHFINL